MSAGISFEGSAGGKGPIDRFLNKLAMMVIITESLLVILIAFKALHLI